MFEPWELAMIDQAGYNGIRDEHIERITDSLLLSGFTQVDRNILEYHCHKFGIDPENFTQADLNQIQEKLSFKSKTTQGDDHYV